MFYAANWLLDSLFQPVRLATNQKLRQTPGLQFTPSGPSIMIEASRFRQVLVEASPSIEKLGVMPNDIAQCYEKKLGTSHIIRASYHALPCFAHGSTFSTTTTTSTVRSRYKSDSSSREIPCRSSLFLFIEQTNKQTLETKYIHASR